MQVYESQRIDLKNKYWVEVNDHFGSMAEILFRRDIGHKTKDHGRIVMSKDELSKLIDALQLLHNTLPDEEIE